MEETAIINNAETDPKKVLNWLARGSIWKKQQLLIIQKQILKKY